MLVHAHIYCIYVQGYIHIYTYRYVECWLLCIATIAHFKTIWLSPVCLWVRVMYFYFSCTSTTWACACHPRNIFIVVVFSPAISNGQRAAEKSDPLISIYSQAHNQNCFINFLIAIYVF